MGTGGADLQSTEVSVGARGRRGRWCPGLWGRRDACTACPQGQPRPLAARPPAPAWPPACLSAHQAGALTRPTLDKTAPLIKVLIELNGCGNEQMSSIKSKESDRPINTRTSIIITVGTPAPGANVPNCYPAIYGNWPHNTQSPTCPAPVIKKMIFYTDAGWAN